MAISTSVDWDVRATGDDGNGGGFKQGASGTDYSLQDSAQVTYADLAIDASDNTKVTSAGNPFTSAHEGNIIKVTSGTGFTAGRYEVTAVASNVATLDRAVGTTSSTGGNGKLGGALLTVAAATAAQGTVSLQKIWIKSGTYTITAGIALDQNVQYTLIGYGATHGDNGTAPNITCATNAIKSFSFTAGSGFFKNLRITSTASTATNTYGIVADYNYPELACEDVEVSGFRLGIDNDGGNFAGIALARCNITGNNISTVKANFRASFYGCIFKNQAYNGTAAVSVARGLVHKCVFYNNPGAALDIGNADVLITHSVFKGNDVGINCGLIDGFHLLNNIFVGHSTAINNGTTAGIQRKNAFYNNTTKRATATGSPGNQVDYFDDITLTGDPFVSTSDWSLNNTAGAGAACQGAGHDVGFTVSPVAPDIGAIQTSGGGGSCDYPAIGDVRDGVTFDTGAQTGTLELPAASDVKSGVGFGESGTEFTGTLSTGVSQSRRFTEF